MTKIIPSLLLILTAALDYVWLFWFRDESKFVHINGSDGLPMYWHVFVLGVMVNFIIIGIVITIKSLSNVVNQITAHAYLLSQICLTGMYLIKGGSENEQERIFRSLLFFIFIGVFAFFKRTELHNFIYHD